MADEQIVTRITAQADFSGLVKDLSRVTTSLATLQERIGSTNRALAGQVNAINKNFSDTIRSTGQFSTHFVSLASDVEKFGRGLDSGSLKLKNYYKAWHDQARTSGGLVRDLAQQQVQLQNAILQPLGKNAQGLQQFNVHVPRGLDIIKNKSALANAELKIMNKVIQDGANQLINWGKNTQWAGRQLSVGLTLPLVAFGKAASDAFRAADQELTRLAKVYGDVSGATQAELKKVRADVIDTAKTLSSSMGVSFNDTIALAADIAATGKTGNDLLQSVNETTRLSVLGEVDRQDAMKATLAIQNAFKQNTTELAQSIDFLNAVENQTSTSLGDLVEAIPKAGPIIKGLGGSIKDLSLYMVAMKEGGISASEGANALKSGLASLINPTKVAVGTMSSFGIDILGMVNKNAGNTTGLLLELQGALDKLDPLKKQQAIEQLFGKFQFARMGALFDNLGRQGSQTLKVLDLMNASTKTLSDVAGRELAMVTESASGKYKRQLESLKADLAIVGEEFLKIGTVILNVLDKVLQFGQKLPEPLKKLLAFGGAFAAMVGPVIMLTGLLANFFGYIVKGIFHLKALFKGGEGFKLLTPDILAANKAGSMAEQVFYSDAKAATVLQQALADLTAQYDILATKAVAGSISLTSTMENLSRAASGQAGYRQVDVSNPLVGGMASSHINPRDPSKPATIFGLVPGADAVNQRIGRTPQIMMENRLPDVPGLTTVSSSFKGKQMDVSTGIVASEAARYQALIGTIGMQSKQEIEQLKKTIAMGGQVSSEFIATFDDILPLTTRLSTNAARESAAIVAELQAGKLSVDQAKAQIIALNARLEADLGTAVTSYATATGRSIDLTKTPLLDQPVVDASGKSNMRALFRKGRLGTVVSALGRATRTRTMGAPYSIETTMPKKYNQGGKVYTLGQGNIVPGVGDKDTVPAILTPGEFVVNKKATAENLPLLQSINGSGSNGPGFVLGSKGPIKTLAAMIAAQTTSYAKTKLAQYASRDAVASNGVIRGNSETMMRLLGMETKKNEAFDPFGFLVRSGKDKTSIIPGMIAKPPTVIHGAKGSDFTALNKLLSGNGVQGKNVRKYIENILKGGEGSVKGSTGQFLDAISGSNIIEASVAAEMKSKIQSAYIRELFRMKRKGIPITDDNNPYFAVSNSTVEQYSKGNPHLDNLWQQFNRKTAAVNPHYLSEMNRGAGAGPGSTGVKDITLENPTGGLGIAVGKLIGSGASGSSVYHATNPVWENSILKNSGMEKLTAKWPKKEQFYQMGHQYMLGNQDPLHGPLQIGKLMTMQRHSGYDPYDTQSVSYNDRFGRVNIMDAFLTGDIKQRGMYATSQYMAGNKGLMGQMEGLGNHPLGPIAAMKALQKKYTGKLYRGVKLGKTFNAIPEDIQKAILEARKTGNLEGLMGKEFIMRRSSWSKNENIASYFAPGRNESLDSILFEASVKNRNVLPASELFPNKVFQAPYGQSWNKTRFGSGAQSEQESIFGGKFKIVGMQGGKVQLETVFEQREKGGPVNAGQPYIVGEKGPELFVPRNSGGIIPRYGAGGMVASMGLGILGSMGGQSLGQQIGGDTGGMIGNMAGFMLPGMLMGGRGVQGGLDEGAKFDAINAKLGKSIFANKKLGETLAGNAMVGGKFSSALSRMALGLTKFNVVSAVAVTAAVALYKAYKSHQETLKNEALAFGMTEKAAAKAGLTYQDTNKKLLDSRKTIQDIRDRNNLVYASITQALPGKQVQLTIEQLRALKEEVKSTMPEYIKLINASEGKDLKNLASSLKAQFMAAGKSAQEATNTVFALISASEKAAMAAKVITSSSFQGIKTLQDAAVQAGKSVSYANKEAENAIAFWTKNARIAGLADSINGFFQAADASLQNLISTEKVTENGIKRSVTAAEALNIQFEKFAKSGLSNVKVTGEMKDALAKSNPILAAMVNKGNSLVGVYAKYRLLLAGVNKDLSKMTDLQSQQVLALVNATEAGAAAVTTSVTGPLGASNQKLINLNKEILALNIAAQGQSVKSQINTRKEVELINKKIDAINAEADARTKALQEEQAASDISLQIKQKQLEYQNALTAGDMQTAAMAQLEIQKLVGSQQLSLAQKAIEAKRLSDLKPLNAKKDAIAAASQNKSDNASLAGESSAAKQKAADALKTALDAVKEDFTRLADDVKFGNIKEGDPDFKKRIAVLLSDYKKAGGDAKEYTAKTPEEAKSGMSAAALLYKHMLNSKEYTTAYASSLDKSAKTLGMAADKLLKAAEKLLNESGDVKDLTVNPTKQGIPGAHGGGTTITVIPIKGNEKLKEGDVVRDMNGSTYTVDGKAPGNKNWKLTPKKALGGYVAKGRTYEVNDRRNPLGSQKEFFRPEASGYIFPNINTSPAMTGIGSLFGENKLTPSNNGTMGKGTTIISQPVLNIYGAEGQSPQVIARYAIDMLKSDQKKLMQSIGEPIKYGGYSNT